MFWSQPDDCVESVRVQNFFLVRIFSPIWTEYEDLESKAPYSLRMYIYIYILDHHFFKTQKQQRGRVL